MKKSIFTLLAVMMFASISVFAQGVEPIKGDVNGDGRVDLADIASIIDIIAKGEAGYFYFGTARPTAENYTSLPGVIGSYTSISEASGATATIAAGETLYMMCPASWMEGKSVELEDESGNPISFLEEKDAITISGYVIYRTLALNDEKTVVLKTQPVDNGDYYFGVATEDQIQNQSYINGLGYNIAGEKPATINFEEGYNVLVVPESWGTPIVKDPNGFTYSEFGLNELGITNPTGKIVLVYSSGQIEVTLEWN